MKKWLIPMISLTLFLAANAGIGFALASNGISTPEVGDPSGDQPPIRSDDGIDPDECNWIHNITACDDALPEPGFALAGDGSNSPVQDNTDVPSPSAMCVEEVPDCNDTLVIGTNEEGTIEPDFSEDGPYLMPTADKSCGPMASVAITSDGEISCLDLAQGNDDSQDMVSSASPPVSEPVQ